MQPDLISASVQHEHNHEDQHRVTLARMLTWQGHTVFQGCTSQNITANIMMLLPSPKRQDTTKGSQHLHVIPEKCASTNIVLHLGDMLHCTIIPRESWQKVKVKGAGLNYQC